MKRLLTLFLAASLLILWSCSKKTDPVTPSLGTISITGVQGSDTLTGTISAQVAVAGPVQINKIDVYANDSLIATSSKVPYNLKWNTQGVNNGNYKLKAIAYDNAGKQTQTTLDVVVHNVLVTLLVDPHINSIYTNVMYIVTDSAGGVLNSIKYNGTDKYIAVAATHPNLNSRCSVFEVKTDPSSLTYITGYMTIPKGSVWNLRGITENLSPNLTNTTINFTGFPAFSRMTIATDIWGLTYTTPTNLITNYGFSPTSKLLVQYVDNSNNGHYNFSDVDTTNKNITINLANTQFQPSVKKSITINGATSGNFSVYGKSDKNYDDYYILDQGFFQGSAFSYFYPDGTYLNSYISEVYYAQNGWNYSNVYTDLLPQTIAPFGTTATVTNNSLSAFNFSAQGNLDYYSAVFYDATDKAYIAVYSPSPSHSFQFPDILKLTNLSGASLSNFKISSFGMYKTPGFNESKLFYYTNEYPSLAIPSQSAIQYFQ